VPFHSGWELVEWVPKSVDLGENYIEILEICDEFEEEAPKVFGPRIEMNLKNPSDMGEPPVEVAGVAPIVEVEDESSVEVLEAKASVEKDDGLRLKEQELSLFMSLRRREQVLSLFIWMWRR